MAAPGTVSYVIHECATAQRSKDTERRTRLEHHARAAGCGIAMASGQDDGVRSLAACVRSVRSVRSVRGTYFRNSMQMCAARRDVCFDFQAKKDGEEEEPPEGKQAARAAGGGDDAVGLVWQVASFSGRDEARRGHGTGWTRNGTPGSGNARKSSQASKP